MQKKCVHFIWPVHHAYLLNIAFQIYSLAAIIIISTHLGRLFTRSVVTNPGTWGSPFCSNHNHAQLNISLLLWLFTGQLKDLCNILVEGKTFWSMTVGICAHVVRRALSVVSYWCLVKKFEVQSVFKFILKVVSGVECQGSVQDTRVFLHQP